MFVCGPYRVNQLVELHNIKEFVGEIYRILSFNLVFFKICHPGETKRLNTVVKALLLRRTKEDTSREGKPIVDLPKKSVEVVEVSLSESERKIYDRLFKRSQ